MLITAYNCLSRDNKSWCYVNFLFQVNLQFTIAREWKQKQILPFFRLPNEERSLPAESTRREDAAERKAPEESANINGKVGEKVKRPGGNGKWNENAEKNLNKQKS